MRNRASRLLALSVGLLFLLGAATAWADNVVIDPHEIDCIGSSCEYQATHNDAAPFKGSITLTVRNTGTQDWGDFHFAFFQSGLETIENVHWDLTNAPSITVNGSPIASFGWSADNEVVGATLDLTFYGNPIEPNDNVTFVVYSDNQTDNVSFFGTLYYPTPVPEPGTAVMMGLALLGLLAAGRRRTPR